MPFGKFSLELESLVSQNRLDLSGVKRGRNEPSLATGARLHRLCNLIVDGPSSGNLGRIGGYILKFATCGLSLLPLLNNFVLSVRSLQSTEARLTGKPIDVQPGVLRIWFVPVFN